MLQQGARVEFEMALGAVRATEKSNQDANGLLVYIFRSKTSCEKVKHCSEIGFSDFFNYSIRDKTFYCCEMKCHTKNNCIVKPKSPFYRGEKSSTVNYKKYADHSFVSFVVRVAEKNAMAAH